MFHQVAPDTDSMACLPSFAHWQRRLIAAEQGRGWLDECDEVGRFLALGQELLDALSLALRPLAELGPVLEVCAGSGDLARALNTTGVPVQATDAKPPNEAAGVWRMTADAAMRHFRPAVVLGVFVPHDAAVDEAVLACPSVQHYLALNARIGGSFASRAFWRTPGWHARPLEAIDRWMITRHDVWLGSAGAGPGELIKRHGEAWHLARHPGR
ncbi:MAG: hypothetical protein ACQESR_31520 [Planctomycetota bacterium]